MGRQGFLLQHGDDEIMVGAKQFVLNLDAKSSLDKQDCEKSYGKTSLKHHSAVRLKLDELRQMTRELAARRRPISILGEAEKASTATSTASGRFATNLSQILGRTDRAIVFVQWDDLRAKVASALNATIGIKTDVAKANASRACSYSPVVVLTG